MNAPADETLRAAAPDLYVALVALVAIHDHDEAGWMVPVPSSYRRHCWARAKAAIAKAHAGAPDRKLG